MSDIYTVTCNYFATGEGHTVMMLVTRAYGPADGKTNALDRFREIFGSYFAGGAEVHEGLKLEPGYERLMHPKTWDALQLWETGDDAPGGLEYFANLHVNFS